MTRRSVVVAVLIAVAIGTVLSYRTWLQPRQPVAAVSASGPLSSDEATRAIGARDSAVAAAFAARDMLTLSRFVHPSRGVRISHYTYVRPDSDLVFSGAELQKAWQGPGEYFWGHADGTGDPIRMTLRAYLEKFIAKDFSKATRIGYNAAPIGTGNTPNNIGNVYPRAIRVEHHFPGFDEQYGGMDWQSLWLIYEQLEGEWYLVGIARGFWTI